MKANYRKINDRSHNSSTYHKKDGTPVRHRLKQEANKQIQDDQKGADKNMNELQENAVRNAWLDLCAVMQFLCGIRETGTLEENMKTEELINASTDSIKELEKNFDYLLGGESMFRS